MKFRFYITDTFDGCIRGTNELKTAKAYSECEDFYVVEADTGHWLLSDGKEEPISEALQLTSVEDDE